MAYNKTDQIKPKTKKKKTKTNRKKLIKACDDLVRQIVLTKEDTCCCCGIKPGIFHPKDNPGGLQLGHYISRRVFPLRWDLRNTHAQCSRDNFNHEHNPLPYTMYMLRTYGEPLLKEFEQIMDSYRKTAKTMTTNQIQDIRDHLTILLIANDEK